MTTELRTASDDQRSADPIRLLSRPLLRVLVIDVCALTTLYLLLAALPLYVAAKGTSGAGAVTAALMWSTLVAEFATPWLVARFGYRLTLAVAIGLIGIPSLLLGYVANLPAILAVCVVCGLGFGVVGVGAGALAASLLPAERRGEGLGLIGAATGAPGVIGLPLGVWLAGHVGFSAAFSAAGAATLIAMVVVPRLPHATIDRGARVSVLGDLRSRALVGPAAVFVAATCAAGIVVAFLPIALGHRSATLATVGLLVQGVAATLSRWWVGRLSDRRGAARFLLPGLIATIAGVFLLIAFANSTVLLIAMVLFGVGFGIVENSTLTLMVERVRPTQYAAANAVWNLAYDGGWGLGAAAFGLIAVHTGYATAFAITGALITVALFPAVSEGRRPRP
jgi:predicted MFS family arabinose efflux permease